jgi:hypothetical protein
MAEGGGTVGYLDKIGTPPPRGVSVHAVIEYDGSLVRMLAYDHACGGLNPADRASEKPYYKGSILRAVLGSWWTDPNSASIQCEIEGFRATGPNPKQVARAIRWVADLRAAYPEMRGAFGHADQTDTKACPGTSPAMLSIFDVIGGHGLWKGNVVNLSKNVYLSGAKVTGGHGIFSMPVVNSDYLIRNTKAGGETLPLVGTVPGFHVVDPDVPGGPAGYIANGNVTGIVAIPQPTLDCTAAIAADRAKAHIVYS